MIKKGADDHVKKIPGSFCLQQMNQIAMRNCLFNEEGIININ